MPPEIDRLNDLLAQARYHQWFSFAFILVQIAIIAVNLRRLQKAPRSLRWLRATALFFCSLAVVLQGYMWTEWRSAEVKILKILDEVNHTRSNAS